MTLRECFSWLLTRPRLVIDFARQASSDLSYEPRGWATKRQRRLPRNFKRGATLTPQEKHWPVIVENIKGTGPLGVSHLPSQNRRDNLGAHNTMMSYGYVLARAARDKESLRILDWGSSLGHYYLYSKVLLPELKLDYHCYDQPWLCRAGRRLLPDVLFHEGGGPPRGNAI